MRDATIRLLQLVYFMAPAYCANMAPPFIKYWRGWNRPIHVRWFGGHKTVVGFAVGVAVGLLATAVQRWIDAPSPIVSYEHWIILGLGFGVGAMGGDAAKSFFKRRVHVPPGKPWVPFDQLDFVIGVVVLLTPWVNLRVMDIFSILAITFVGDVTANQLAFRWGIKDAPS